MQLPREAGAVLVLWLAEEEPHKELSVLAGLVVRSEAQITDSKVDIIRE